ncbi:hypothetical protein OEZ86_002801 [Tetradesmus obliquus]|nr:hypothetical protein OEZ86_002801 [Tetradesmus obliquus]
MDALLAEPQSAASDTLLRLDRKSPVRAIGGVSILSVLFVFFQILWPLRWNLVALYVAIEALFYTFYWRPRWAELNKQPVPHRPSKHDAMKAFKRCIKYFKQTPDLDIPMYFAGWFLGAKSEDVKKGNAEEFLAYAFWYRTLQEMHDEGLGHILPQMVEELESVWHLKLEPGHAPHVKFMGHLWEPLKASWRPLAFYMATAAVGWLARQMLKRWGFEQHRHENMAYFTLNMGNRTNATDRSCSSGSSISDASVASALSAMSAGSPSVGGAAAPAAPVPEAAKSAKSSPAVFAAAAANASAAASTSEGGAAGAAMVAGASGMQRSKSSPFAAAGVDWAAKLAADADFLAASINAASAVHGASIPIIPAAAAPAAPAAQKPRSGWRARMAARRQAVAAPVQPPLVPYLSTHTSVMLKTMPNPLEDALESGLGGKDMPVLFLHGVGGLPAYLEMMLQVMALGHPLIVVECAAVAMRLGAVSTTDEVVGAVVGIMDKLGVEEACVIGHSYGTFIAGRLARLHRKRVHSLCLIDPVCFGMFMPQLLSNFLYNAPQWKGLHHVVDFVKKSAVYMASHELHVCATFSRGFFWTDLNLWPEDLAAGSVVLLSGRDDLMNARQVQAMLERCGHVKVHYNTDLTHGEFLIKSEVKQAIMGELRAMLARSGNAVVGLARPVLKTTITLVHNAIGATKVRLHTTKAGNRYVEDHTNNLVRTFTGNLTAMLSTMGTNGVNSPTAHMASSRSGGGSGLRSRFAPDSARSKSAGGALAGAQQSNAAAAAVGSAVPGKAVSAGGSLAQTYSLPVKKQTPRQQWVKSVLSKGAAADAAAAAAQAAAAATEGEDMQPEQPAAEENTNSSSHASNNKRPVYAAGQPLKGALARRGSREGRRSSSNGGVQRKVVVMSDGVEVIPTCSIAEGCEDSI